MPLLQTCHKCNAIYRPISKYSHICDKCKAQNLINMKERIKLGVLKGVKKECYLIRSKYG